MSITSCGSVVVWSDVAPLSEELETDILVSTPTFKKEFVKSVKMSDNPLHVIASIDDFVMLCDSLGQIRFYDKELKILFWCPTHESIDSIVSISFDLKRKPETAEDDDVDVSMKTLSIRDFFVRKILQQFLTNFKL